MQKGKLARREGRRRTESLGHRPAGSIRRRLAGKESPGAAPHSEESDTAACHAEVSASSTSAASASASSPRKPRRPTSAEGTRNAGPSASRPTRSAVKAEADSRKAEAQAAELGEMVFEVHEALSGLDLRAQARKARSSQQKGSGDEAARDREEEDRKEEEEEELERAVLQEYLTVLTNAHLKAVQATDGARPSRPRGYQRGEQPGQGQKQRQAALGEADAALVSTGERPAAVQARLAQARQSQAREAAQSGEATDKRATTDRRRGLHF
ncbi:hypothetical protein NCLIV_067250 [Neospora caninum Liverpool]|uniref:Uncharacterized protein n=1 Tax=Neospora caninum (strain Liverpool) TaxID=572307 RepID=F0VRF2_NEOCL|nr:hypothetical protein NCLIV_067250 [Neospora caninum Liverpool]CBZ56300.1 hypothetical protein NCLIV_067250 [Neospora caninum Liverpool]CEL71062.1 TPA: hypothetical protein BN1204_067250 [Neospora caninum Liverpool]|eukprot:XP_003886325.1 hypothetical protein NCLIV_067250 [Neospora caninum Liverpool]